MDDLDARLRTRLIRLADAAAMAGPDVRARPATAPRMRAALPVGALVAVAVLVGAVALLPRLAGFGPAAGTSPTPTSPVGTSSASALPSGGITRAAAISIASEHVPPQATLVSAQAGRFGDVELPGLGGTAARGIASNRWVWAVVYQGTSLLACPEPASTTCAALSRAPFTVLLDFFTGDYLDSGYFGSPAVTPVPSSTPAASPLPSGGISRDQAIALASPHVADPTTFISAVAERYRDTGFAIPGLGDTSIAPDRWVWAIVFEGPVGLVVPPPYPTPAPTSSVSPEPPASMPTAVTTVLIDYFTGDFLRSEAHVP